MTTNAPASVLLAFYLVAAERQGVGLDQVGGTIQNDLLKEYVARGTYIYPPEPSMRLRAVSYWPISEWKCPYRQYRPRGENPNRNRRDGLPDLTWKSSTRRAADTPPKSTFMRHGQWLRIAETQKY